MISLPYALSIMPGILAGLETTVALLIVSWVVGHAAAVAVALARTSRSLTLRVASWTYMQLIRGTPLLVQMYLFYYGLGSLFSQSPALRHSFACPLLRDSFWYAVVALGISTGEILRGAILAVPRGEIEAARSLGLRQACIIWLIILPRAIQPNLSTLAGEAIILMKSTLWGKPTSPAPKACASTSHSSWPASSTSVSRSSSHNSSPTLSAASTAADRP